MPPHLQVWNNGGAALADPITVSQVGGTESAAIVREIWNDKNSAFGDTTTGTDLVIKLLAAWVVAVVDDVPEYGAFKDSGNAVLDERWFRIRITAVLTAAGETAVDSGSLPFGTNAGLHIDDMPPQTGIRVELRAITPGAQVFANAVKLQFAVDDNSASSPLSPLTALSTGSAVIPADRIAGERALLRGSEVTANDTATVTIARGSMAYDGATITFPQTTQVFNLLDSAAVALLAGEDYRVTLSRSSVGAVVVTKSLKNAATAPDTPTGNVFIRNLTVESADGVAVTVGQASVVGSPAFAECLVRDGGGLSVIVSRGRTITSTDHQQHVTHDIPVGLAASVTSRIWILPDGSAVDTLTDVEPEIGAVLLALVTTDTDSVVLPIVDARAFAHRAVTEWHPEMTYADVLTGIAEPSHGLALMYLYDDCEIDAIELNLTALDALWSAGALKIDLFTFAPGAAVPFPAGGAGGVSMFTSSATDDRRPSIAFDAASLRVVVVDHEVRRFVAGTRVLLSIVETMTLDPLASLPEEDQEIRVAFHARRYR